MHACWFCSGPAHFAAVAASVACAALGEGRAVWVFAPAHFLAALRTACGCGVGGELVTVDSAGVDPAEMAVVAVNLPDRTLVLHAVEAASRASVQSIEELLEGLTTSRHVTCLCAYDLSAVEAWSADAVAQRHHVQLLTGGRLVPVSEVLGPVRPVESPPREPAH